MILNLKNFIIANKSVVLLGLVVYAIFLFFTISGNQICDCVATEKSTSGTRTHVGVTRFYHK